MSPRASRGTIRRRRMGAGLLVAALLVGLAAVAAAPLFKKAVEEFTLPLRHEDIIRQQARDKRLDPSLIAAVIYAESKFRDQTSPAGAKGLMQILPSTAEFIAKDSGGTEFEVGDLSTPQVNIAYGSYYLRYLLRRYGGNEVLAVAAYNAGETNVDRWIVEARSQEKAFVVDDIPFPETRHYVERVFDARERYYEERAKELGIG